MSVLNWILGMLLLGAMLWEFVSKRIELKKAELELFEKVCRR